MSQDDDFIERAMSEFKDRFYAKLAQRARTMEFMLHYYLVHSDERPFILETGTARTRGDFAGDGQSTLLWDFAIQQHDNGQGISIDSSMEACRNIEIQVSERMKILCADSVYGLSNIDPEIIKMTGLLYLDSFDLDIQNSWPSSIHHLMELTAVWALLPEGCLVAVDDCFSDKVGKHLMVEDFFKKTDAKLIMRGYQMIWVKQ